MEKTPTTNVFLWTLIKNLVLLIFSRGFSMIFRFLIKIIIARFADLSIYGAYSIVWNEMTFLSTLFLFGLGQKMTIHIPRMNKDHQQKLIFQTILFCSLISLIAFLIFIISGNLFIETTYYHSLKISIMFLIFLSLKFIFIGLSDFFGYFLLDFLQNLLLLSGIIIFRQQLTLTLISNLSLLSITICVVSALFYLKIKHRIRLSHGRAKIIDILKFDDKRIYLFIVDVLNTVILYLLLKIPSIIVDVGFSGYVDVAFSIMSFILIIPQMISISIGPSIAKFDSNNINPDIHKKNKNKFSRKITKKVGECIEPFKQWYEGIEMIFLFQLLIIPFFMIFGREIIGFFYGENISTQVMTLYYLFLFNSIIDSLSNIFGILIRNLNFENKFAMGKIYRLLVFVPTSIIFLIFFPNKEIAIGLAYILGTLTINCNFTIFIIKNFPVNKRKIVNIFLWVIVLYVNFLIIWIFLAANTKLIWGMIFFIFDFSLLVILLNSMKIIKISKIIKMLKDIIIKKIEINLN